MTVKDLLVKLEDGATKMIIVDKEGIILFAGIWFSDIEEKIMDKEISRIQVEDYLLNIFI